MPQLSRVGFLMSTTPGVPGVGGSTLPEPLQIAGSSGFTRANNTAFLSAMTQFKAGTLSPKIVFIGDSTTAGFGATAVNGWAGSRVLAPPARCGVALEAQSIACTSESLWGRSGSASFFATYLDPQVVTPGASWTTGTSESIGGLDMYDCTSAVTTTTSVAFAEAGDMVEVTVFSIASSVTYEVSFDNATWQSSGAGPTSQGIARTTFTSATGASSTVYIRRAAGTSLFIQGVSLFSSTTPKLRLENMGRGSASVNSGAASAQWLDTTNSYSRGNTYTKLGAHLAIINLTTNDHASTADPTTPMAGLATMAAGLQAQGTTVWFMVPHPASNCTTTVLDNYRAAIIAQAAASNVTCIDLMSDYNRNSGWSGASLGYYNADGVHPNAAGYDYIGQREAALIKAIYDIA